MGRFSIEGFATECKNAMSTARNRHRAAKTLLEQTLREHDAADIIDALDAAIPPDATIGEMIVHTSPELTMLYARIPPRFQSGIHNHTVFACIGQLAGAEKGTIYEESPDGGLRVVRQLTVRTGEVIGLPADVIHSIENPGHTVGSALHLYGGDFGALMEQRSLWTSDDHEKRPFSFEALVLESVKTMKRDNNETGLRELVKAMPAARPLLESLRAD